MWIFITPTGSFAPNWSLILAAPNGGSLAPGTYTTSRFGTATTYGLDLGGDGHGCNMSSGLLTIYDVAFDPEGQNLRHLRASFENHCEGKAEAVRGNVAILADPWR